MNAEEMLMVVRKFVSYGAPDSYDDQGPNKFDWGFFETMSYKDKLSLDDVAKCAHRLRKYRTTQMPRAFSECGLEWNPHWDTLIEQTEEAAAAVVPTVTCAEYDETRYGKNDVHRRWPKTSKRIAIHWDKRSRQLWLDLKNDPALKFPAFKWDGEKMSCKYDKNILSRVIEILESHGYVTDELKQFRNGMAAPAPARTEQSYGVTVVKDSVVLTIPYADSAARETVKTINGRKWLNDEKAWRISIHEAANLISKLGDDHELSKAMSKDERISGMVVAKAERVAISGAAALDDTEVLADMEQRLSDMFPEHLSLYPFQYAGVRFAELAEGRCFIGDDMGVGKTIQAIAYAALHTELWPVLVVCPANVKYNWVKELTTWLPDCVTDVVVNGKDEVRDADFTVINYDLVHKKKSELLAFGYNLVIFDESHYLKNRGTKKKPVLRTQACIEIGQTTESVLCLSGTAMTNRPVELFTTLELVRPAEYEGQFMPFAKRYCGAEWNGFGWDFTGATHTDELHEKLRDVMIRRLKKEVMEELPDKVRSFVPVVPTPAEMTQYKDVNRTWVREYNSGGKHEPGFVLNMLTDLRHQCGRLKVSAALKWIEDYKHQNDKPIVVFTHHRDVMQALCEALEEDYKYATISGDVDSKTRMDYVEKFQANELDVLVCSTVAAKEGLTLTAADTVLFIEREWSPAWEEQAEDRVNRIGQDSDTVWATYLSVAGTIDEKFDRIVEYKRANIKSVLDGGDIIEREGIAKALIEAMVESGELPEDMLAGFSKYAEEE